MTQWSASSLARKMSRHRSHRALRRLTRFCHNSSGSTSVWGGSAVAPHNLWEGGTDGGFYDNRRPSRARARADISAARGSDGVPLYCAISDHRRYLHPWAAGICLLYQLYRPEILAVAHFEFCRADEL